MIIACINSKGGVGKSTSTVNLCHGLAMEGYKTLIVDLDSQGSASISLGFSRKELSPSIAEVLLEDVPIEDAIRETSVENLHLLTGSMSLANFDIAVADREGREALIKDVLKSLNNKYDYILLDCPPSLGMIPINALNACDHYLIPTMPHYLAVEGMVNLLEAIDRVKGGLGAQCSLLGILLTMVDLRSVATKEIIAILREQFNTAVFNTHIMQNIRLAEAPSHGKTVFQHDWSSTGAQAYQQATKELLERTGKTKTIKVKKSNEPTAKKPSSRKRR